jgi:subtilisin family serine protease
LFPFFFFLFFPVIFLFYFLFFYFFILFFYFLFFYFSILGKIGKIIHVHSSSAPSQILGLPSATAASYVHKIQAPEAFTESEYEVPNDGVDAIARRPEEIHTITGVNRARQELGLTGTGVKVGVIDTGVWYKHPALGGCFGPGCRVESGWDFVGDLFTGDPASPLIPDPDPLDECTRSAHGTHVAGIVAANAAESFISQFGNRFLPPVYFTGVAPNATLAGYRVFGCSGYTTDDLMAAAIYRAAHDGCHVINMSIGGGPNYAEDPSAIAAAVVGSRGHFVTGSNGNDGRSGSFTQAGVGVNPGALAIGSFDNVAVPSSAIYVNSEPFPFPRLITGPAFPAGDNVFNYTITNPDADARNVTNDGCTAFPAAVASTIRGRVAIMRMGSGCSASLRCSNAATAGATGCIIYGVNDVDFRISGTSSIPAGSTTNSAGKAIIAAFRANTPARITFNILKQGNFPIASAGTVSDFSSLGLDPELWIKPDIAGIGGQVLSTVSTVPTGNAPPYRMSSGTSMSAPYVAGAIALLVESKRDIKFPEVKSRLVNHAQPARLLRNPQLTDSVARQGGGLVNIFNSITAKTVVYPSSLSLNDTVKTQQHYTIEIHNSHNVPVTYTLASFGAAQINPFRPNEDMMLDNTAMTYTADYANVTFRGMPTRSFRIQANSIGRANIDFEPPQQSPSNLFPVFSGYITVTNDIDNQIIRIPYAGMKGDWSAAPIFVRNSPLLAQAQASNPIFSSQGFRTTTTPSVGAYLRDGQFTPVPSNRTLINGRDGLLLTIPAATTTRGFKVEIRYLGGDRRTRERIESLGARFDNHKPLLIPNSFTVSLNAQNQFTTTPYGPLYAAFIQRNVPRSAQSVVAPDLYFWDLKVYPNTTSTEPIFLPNGEYQVKFSGQKHFKRVGTIDSNFDIFNTNTFRIVNA